MHCALPVAAEGGNADGYEVVVFVVLLFCCFAMFAFEIAKRMRPEVTIEKLVALGVGVCYMVVMVIIACIGGGPPIELARGLVSFLMMVSASLGLIWFDDVLGDMVGLKSGLVSKTSPGFLVRFMGWVFLLGMIGMPLYFAFAR